MKSIRVIFLGLGMLFVPCLLPAQVENLQSLLSQFNWSSVSATDSVVQIIAEQQGLPSVSPDSWPIGATYWYVLAGAHGGVSAPLPTPPQDTGTPVYLISDGIYLVDATGGQIITPQNTANNEVARAAVAAQASAVSNLINQVQETVFERQLTELFGEDESQNPGDLVVPTNTVFTGLALQITNVSNGYACLNLLNATNWVYAIWSTTNLLSPWQMETELWPENTNSYPFTLATQGRQNLFLRAEDWTDVDSDGDGIPDWWVWFWYGDFNETATNLDANSNTLFYDYSNGLDPNILAFTIIATNNYFSGPGAALQLAVASGSPYYLGVLEDSTNFDTASWNYYTSSNITVNLGSAQGWHDMWVGLAGFADDVSTTVWQWKHLNLAGPPVLVITNPTTSIVDKPMIQIYGFCQEPLARLSYGVSNSIGVTTGQPSEITDQYYDSNAGNFTTNYFECLDVPLANGLNIVTIRATDLAGDTISTNFNFTLDYSAKTNPPAFQISWPQNGTELCGNSFTCRGILADPTATVTASSVNGNNTRNFLAIVERNGKFWLQNLPLNSGTNLFSIQIVDAAGNTSATNLTVVQSALSLTIDPVTPASQLWQPTVYLTGRISDPNYAIWANGVKGHNNRDGTWYANNVPVNAGGTASFVATAYAPTESQPDGSYGN